MRSEGNRYLPDSRIAPHYRCRRFADAGFLGRTGVIFCRQAAFLLLSLGLTHELGDMVKLAQEIVREMLICGVSLSFLNLFCVNVNFGVKLHGAVGLRA